ncbi:hypothetical protein M8J75_007973 [Diaphorina citri]|nr:hypothetical protein M8J75_007973 [Diaphorina citri]
MNSSRAFAAKLAKNVKSSNLVSQYSSGSSSQNISGNVPGLSEKVLAVPKSAVGPGASKSSDYKNPEYFSYNKNSYFEAEIEMLKYRCPQPKAKESRVHK